MSTHGVIAAGDAQTAEAGAVALRAGGNAVDAVVAAAFAAFVCEPPLTSPAGAGALLYGDASGGFSLLDFFAATPGIGLARRPALDFHEVVVDFGGATQAFHVGRGAAAVPGALRGLLDAHRDGGRLPLAEVLAPATALARDGFVVSEAIAWILDVLAPIMTLTPGVKALTCLDGALPRAGTTLRNPRFADFLDALARDSLGALRVFDEALLDVCGPAGGGLLTRADLERYGPVRRQPLPTRVGPYTVLTNPPPSSGGGLIAFGLRLADHLQLGHTEWLGPAWVDGVARVLGATSALRADGYDAHIHDRATIEAMIDAAAIRQWAGRAVPPEHPLGSTTHVSVLDGQGGAASLTTSNGEGCGYALDGLGIHVNNFLGEADINPLGFHRLAAGTWMSTMMSPTVVLRDGAPRLVLGSGGSNRIRSVVLQALLGTLLQGRPLEEVIEAPRLHVEGTTLWFEGEGLGDEASERLLRAWPGATRFPTRNMFFGGVHSAALYDGALVAFGDPRRGGATARSSG